MALATRTQDRSREAQPRAPMPRGWRRDQDRMVSDIAGHAIQGGSRIAGPGATNEQAIAAYLEVLRRDLLDHAAKGG